MRLMLMLMLMLKPTHTLAWAGVLSTVLILGLSAWTVQGLAHDTRSGLTLSTASIADLASFNISLAVPPAGAAPAISETDAATIESRLPTAGTIREEQLAWVTCPGSPAANGILAWVVSTVPDGGLTHFIGTGQPLNGKTVSFSSYSGFVLTFIDATTGKQLFVAAEAHPDAGAQSERH